MVAEAVETEQQREFLREHGCDEVQGFLLAPPVEAGAVVRYLVPSAVVVQPVSSIRRSRRPA